MLKIMGYSEALIRKVEETLAENKLTKKEKAALEFALKVSRSAPRPSEGDLQELTAAGFSAIEIAEIAYLAGINACGNRFATMLALPPDPRKRLKRMVHQTEAAVLAQRLRAAAFASSGHQILLPIRAWQGILESLKGSPAEAALATVLNGAWNSTITSRR
jgi:hypothetical protein